MYKICIVTSTRADYGIMSNLINKMSKDKDISFRLCVTGTHLSTEYGFTRNYIDLEEKYIDEINILKGKNDLKNVFINTIVEFDDYFKANKFDLVILLGDRYEIFCIAAVAYSNKIKLAHIHGGEITYGALDEEYRHCITKMANIHFASCERYRERIIQLGESPNRVFNVGSLSVENIAHLPFKNRDDLKAEYGFELTKYAMVTFNPVTRAEDNGLSEIKELMKALSCFDYELIISYPNIDEGNEEIINVLKAYKLNKYHLVKSLPYVDYLSLAKNSNLFIGNSSAGIIEIPSLGVPIVNVGNRQHGREVSPSVICCDGVANNIVKAVKCIDSKEYKALCAKKENIYFKLNTANQIIEEVKKYLSQNDYEKYFYDIKK